MSVSEKDELERARLSYWENKRQLVTGLLQRILDEYYQGQGTISENWVLPFYCSSPTLPNLVMTPDNNYMNLERLVVTAEREGFFKLFKMTHSSGRYAIRQSVHESHLYESMKLVLGTFLFPNKGKRIK